MQHCKHRHTPVFWDQTLCQFGDGIPMGRKRNCRPCQRHCSNVHLPAGRHVFVGFNRSGTAPRGYEQNKLLGMLQLFASSVVEPVLTLLCHDQSEQLEVDLILQEIECLKWAVEGKTAYETSLISSLSHSRVGKILSSSVQKLDVLLKQSIEHHVLTNHINAFRVCTDSLNEAYCLQIKNESSTSAII